MSRDPPQYFRGFDTAITTATSIQQPACRMRSDCCQYLLERAARVARSTTRAKPMFDTKGTAE